MRGDVCELEAIEMSYRFKTDCVSATVFKVAQFRNQSVNQREGETMTTGSEDAEGFSKMIETNIWDSPYLDLVIIQNHQKRDAVGEKRRRSLIRCNIRWGYRYG